MSLPTWFWPWLKWYLGKGEYLGRARDMSIRPAGAPTKIPQWAWDRLKLHVKYSPPPPPMHPDSMELFKRPGAWITRIDHFVPEWLEAGEYLNPDGEYRYVVLPCLYGTEMEAHTEELDREIARYKAVGLKVVGSQWGRATNQAEAEAEAVAALRAINRYGFDGWVMNGEKIYEGGGKSGAYARRFRVSRPNFPFAWSPEPRISLDHQTLQQLNVVYMPQAYPLENGWHVRDVMNTAMNLFGYKPENVVPLVQAYLSPAGERYPATMYRDEARAAGCKGLILYTGNQTISVPQYWRDLVV